MKSLSRGVLAATLASAVLAPPALAVDTSIRVEGADRTLVPATPVTLPGPAVDKTAEGGTTCAPTTAGSALEAATRGAWGGRADSQGQRLERIGDTRYPLGDEYTGRYWAIYVNDRPSSFGICRFDPQQGDEVLIYAACGGQETACFAGEPLDFAAPRTVRPGEAFDVTVQEVTTTYGGAPDFAASTSEGPAADAEVVGADAAARTGADGRARVTLTRRGETVLTARKGTRVPESQTVCVTDGADGFCGTTVPGQPAAPGAGTGTGTGTAGAGAAPGPCVTNGRDGRCGTPDRTAPRTGVTSVREQQRFTRGTAPRVLRGRAGDGAALRAVELRLTRTDGRRCSRYDGARERFVAVSRCGARGRYFTIGDRAEFEYQLAERLGRGRYVLDVRAVDAAGNKDYERRRGENRVVFTVR